MPPLWLFHVGAHHHLSDRATQLVTSRVLTDGTHVFSMCRRLSNERSLPVYK